MGWTSIVASHYKYVNGRRVIDRKAECDSLFNDDMVSNAYPEKYEKIGKFDERVPRLVTEMWGDGVIVGSDSHTTKWKELLERFVFENNEPCGKLQEEK